MITKQCLSWLCRVLQRWADHVLHTEHNIWRYCHHSSFFLPMKFFSCVVVVKLNCCHNQICRALILYVAAGALQEALAALRDAQQPDTAAMFLLACHEINAEITSKLEISDKPSRPSVEDKQAFILPHLNPEHVDVIAVSEYYAQYQRKLVHLCMDSTPAFD